MKREEFECDGCGKVRELGPGVVGWFDVAEVVLATRKDQPRWQFCSSLCLSLFSAGYVPGEAPEEQPDKDGLIERLRSAWSGTEEHAPIGQYL